MKYIFLLLLLGSCQTTPKKFNGERCQTFFAFDAAQKIIPEESICRCTEYEISMELIGNVSPVVTRHPIEYCHEKIGYSPKQNNNLVNFYKAVKDDIQSNQNEKSKNN